MVILPYGGGSNPIAINLSGMEIYLLFEGSLGTRVLTHSRLVMTHSSPWKIPTINGGLVRWENHL